MFQRFGARTHDAEDLAQEGLARLLGRTTGARSPVSLGFAAAVGRNLWRDRMRQMIRRQPTTTLSGLEEFPAGVPSPHEEATASEEKVRLGAALDTLDPRHREAIKLVILEGRSYAEAARILDVPRGTVKSRIHYGIQRLRVRLGVSESAWAEGRREPSC